MGGFGRAPGEGDRLGSAGLYKQEEQSAEEDEDGKGAGEHGMTLAVIWGVDKGIHCDRVGIAPP